MKKTLADCRRFKIIFMLCSFLLLVAGIIVIAIDVVLHIDLIFIPIILIIFGVFGLIMTPISMKILVYDIDGHQVICFCGFSHDYMIVDEQVVDRAGMSGFTSPTLTHKLGDKQLEFSHKRLKVNGELMMPNK